MLKNLRINIDQAIGSRGSSIAGVENSEAWISPPDTGCGTAPAALRRIFEPFYPTMPIVRGTGRGLATTYGIIAKHFGRNEVSREAGAGSAFRVVVLLPAVPPTVPPPTVAV